MKGRGAEEDERGKKHTRRGEAGVVGAQRTEAATMSRGRGTGGKTKRVRRKYTRDTVALRFFECACVHGDRVRRGPTEGRREGTEARRIGSHPGQPVEGSGIEHADVEEWLMRKGETTQDRNNKQQLQARVPTGEERGTV